MYTNFVNYHDGISIVKTLWNDLIKIENCITYLFKTLKITSIYNTKLCLIWRQFEKPKQ